MADTNSTLPKQIFKGPIGNNFADFGNSSLLHLKYRARLQQLSCARIWQKIY